MWTLASWQGRYVRHPLPAGERLRAYARWCNAVEGNTTFYATPRRATVETWARQTGADFRFVVKLPRTVTHERRLTGADAEVAAFLDAIEPLRGRAHALWVQLPATFGPADLGLLERFLRTMPREHRYVAEVRHPAFFTDRGAADGLRRVLTGVGAEWAPFDTTVLFATPPVSAAEREAWANKPRLPRRAPALTDAPMVRYIGRDSVAETAAGWRGWAERVAQWLREGRSPTVFVHTPDNAEALPLARRFHADVRALVPDLEALPEPEPVRPLTLF